MRTTMRWAVLSLLLVSTAAAQEYTIKFATVAPEGSTWMNVMLEYDAAVRKESGGRVGFKIYPRQTQGDEHSVLRKIRVGQLQAGGFTGVGLGEVAPEVRIMDTPFLVRNYAEADHLYKVFDGEFRKAFEDGGFVLLGWAEVGFVYVFTNIPIEKPEDLNKLKMWVWEGDPVAETAFRTLNLKPIPLSILDVMTSLQTGLIDAFYTSPLAAVALQWFTQVKYMIGVPLADASGAILVSKRYFDTIPPDLQQILIRNGAKYMEKLTRLSREDNEKAIETLKKQGIKVLSVPENDIKQYVEAGDKARQQLVGTLYTQEFLDHVKKALADFRASKETQ